MKRIFFAAAVTISSIAQAQTDTTKSLETVVVTANKIEQKQNETSKVLTVITKEMIERNKGRSVSELLNEQVGIIIGGANNNYGTNQTVYVRGGEAANTLIMIDGVPLNDASGVTSAFDINTFSFDQLERIEILKGAQSTLYGSDAVAGVINFISKKSEPGMHVGGQISAGSFGTVRTNFNLRGNEKDWQYYAGYSLLSSNGFSSAADTTGKNNFDKDAFEQHVMQFSLGYDGIKNLECKLFGKYNINNASIDAGAFQDDKDYTYRYTNNIAGLNVKYKLGKSFINLLYNYNRYNRSYIDDSTDVAGVPYASTYTYDFIYQNGKYYGRSHFAEMYANVFINEKLNLVSGIDYRKNNTSQTYAYTLKNIGTFESLPLDRDTAETDQSSVYASLLYNDRKQFTAGAGGRFNHHSVYGNVSTFSVNVSYQINKMKLFANASSGYRVPSLYQLFSEYGNKNLKPERSVNYEGGLQYQNKFINARAVAFKRDIKDVFAFYFDPVTYASNYINFDKQKDYGVEVEATITPVSKLSIVLNYTFTDGKIETKTDLGKDTSYNNLYRRPKHIINAGIGYQFTKSWMLSVHARSVSKFYEPKYGDVPTEIKGYVVVNAHTSYQFNKNFRAFVDVQDITDKKYVDQPGFNTRALSYHGGLVFDF